MTKVDATKLKERYEKARSEWQDHLKRERTQRRKQKSKDDTERKIVAGELLLSLVESGEWPRERFLARLDATLMDNKRRELFDLPPLPDAPHTAPEPVTTDT